MFYESKSNTFLTNKERDIMKNNVLKFSSSDYSKKTKSELLNLKKESEEAIRLANEMLINHLELLKRELGFINSGVASVPAMNRFEIYKKSLIDNQDIQSSESILKFTAEVEESMKLVYSDFIKQIKNSSRTVQSIGVIKDKHLSAINSIDLSLKEQA
jgi:hypothetical protein